MRKKSIIISSCDYKYGDFLINHWLKSLIENVKLDNIDIAILDYGLSKNQKDILKSKKIKVVECVKDGHIVNIRYMDMLKFLNKNNYGQVLSCDSGDIIFQEDISQLFHENKRSYRGVYEDIARIEMFSIFMGSFPEDLRKSILKRLKGKKIINAGFILAPSDKFKGLCKEIDNLIINKDYYGLDQIILNYVLYNKKFIPLDKKFNFIPTTMNDSFKIKKGIFYDSNGTIIPVVHNAGRGVFSRVIKKFGYGKGYNHFDIVVYYFLRIIYKIIMKVNSFLN